MNEDTNYEKIAELYPLIYDWLTTKPLFGNSSKSNFRYYNDKLWIPIRNLIFSIKSKEKQSKFEQELIDCCYFGELYRLQLYNERLKGHIYPMGYYQSWTTKVGLENLIGNRCGNVLLIYGHTNENDIAINTFKLLCFIMRNYSGILPIKRCDPKHLLMYEKESEIVMPIKKETISKLVVADAKKLKTGNICGKEITYEKWYRKELY